jgi:hypothetical protein
MLDAKTGGYIRIKNKWHIVRRASSKVVHQTRESSDVACIPSGSEKLDFSRGYDINHPWSCRLTRTGLPSWQPHEPIQQSCPPRGCSLLWPASNERDERRETPTPGRPPDREFTPKLTVHAFTARRQSIIVAKVN